METTRTKTTIDRTERRSPPDAATPGEIGEKRRDEIAMRDFPVMPSSLVQLVVVTAIDETEHMFYSRYVGSDVGVFI
jgi:hypothetical protein